MRGNLKTLLESHVADAGNIKEGAERLGKDVIKTLEDPKYDYKKDFSIKEAFDTVVLSVNPDLDLNNNSRVAEAVGVSVFPYITKQLIARELLPAYEMELFGISDLFSEMETTRTDYETIAGMRAVTLLPRVRPGQNFPTANWGEKNVQIEVAKFGEILEIEKELVISDQTGQVLSRAREAGTMMGAHRHRFMVETICDGARDALEETSSTAFTYDKTARTVYATTHTTIDGVANSNLSASTDLDNEGLNAVYTLASQMTDEKGRYITSMPKAILVHPSQFPTAWQFTSGLEQPDTAERAQNFYRSQLKLTPYQSPYVYSSAGSRAATDFYVGDFTRQCVWMWVIRPAVDNEGATSSASFERDVIARYKFHYFGGAGMKDYRFIVKATA